ncbi:MAG: potassium channel protein [Bradyrhizobium sp.]|nr:potassium channel protein [Bradyrhizobium sp.]
MAILATVIAMGTVGYVLIEDLSILDAFYMTIITVTTVGFKEVRDPASASGKLLTIAVILCGVGTAGYSVGVLAQALIGGEVRRLLGRRKLDKQIQQMHGHFIICGFGKMGRLLCAELAEARTPFVVVDKSTEATAETELHGWLYILGDASDSVALRAAGIERARGMASVLGGDAENVFTALTARQLNPDLFIIARARDPQTVPKLRAAGANKVVSPHMIGAGLIAGLITRPDVIDLVELISAQGRLDLRLRTLRVKPTSPFVGQSLRDTRLRQEFGITVFAIKHPSGETTFNPPSTCALGAEDALIVIAPPGVSETLDEKFGLLADNKEV